MKISECYETLNLSPQSGWTEVKKSYRSLARKYHPDVHVGRPGFPSKFRKITRAFKILEVSHKVRNAECRNFYKSNNDSETLGNDRSNPAVQTPTRLTSRRKTKPLKKSGLGKKLQTFRQTLFEWERNLFLLDTKKDIHIAIGN